MAMDLKEIEKHIKEALPDALVEIQDLAGDGNHYSATITSSKFSGKSKIEQHKMVYNSLKGKMGNELHASSDKNKGAIMDDQIKNLIQNHIDNNDVCLFMKGTPDAPQCGFSMAVANLLKILEVNYKGVNVLEDQSLREGIKTFSDWPTIPQLYVKKEFVGGCDIVKEMYENGELKKVFDDKGVNYKK